MYRINIRSKKIYLEDVKSSELGRILEWYNKTSDYVFATGKERPITMSELWKKYQEFVEDPETFFATIYRNEDNEPLGLFKGGFLKGKKDALWIGVLLIITKYQKLGYASETISVFFNKIKLERDVKIVYLSCSKHNFQGVNFWNKMGFCNSEKIVDKQLIETGIRDIVIMEKRI